MTTGNYAYQCCGYARIAHQETAIWRTGYPHRRGSIRGRQGANGIHIAVGVPDLGDVGGNRGRVPGLRS